MTRSIAVLALAGALGLTACAGQPLPPDQPVPAGEPRAELRARLDLEPTQGCEERFDLSLYQSRGIDLIRWDARRDACEGREVRVRYLPRQLTREQVVAALGQHARRVQVLP